MQMKWVVIISCGSDKLISIKFPRKTTNKQQQCDFEVICDGDKWVLMINIVLEINWMISLV